jgi:hypothetical protein
VGAGWVAMFMPVSCMACIEIAVAVLLWAWSTGLAVNVAINVALRRASR